MSTTVHLPPDLLQDVDRRATELGLSRNRYIRAALERALQHETGWSASFLEMLEAGPGDPEQQKGVAEMMRVIASGRRSRKKPPKL